MEVKVGNEYLLSVPKDLNDDPIDYLGKISAPRYVKWGEIVGKRVKVKTVLKSLSNYYEVFLTHDVNHIFYVPKKMLSNIPRLPIRCDCTSRQLFLGGCGCGAFKKEQTN